MRARLRRGPRAGAGPPEHRICSAAPSFPLAFSTAPQMWAGAGCGAPGTVLAAGGRTPTRLLSHSPQTHRVTGRVPFGVLGKEAPLQSLGGSDVIPPWFTAR